MKKIAFVAIVGITLLTACNNNSNKTDNTTSTPNSTENYELIGKKATLVYPEFKAEVNYLSDSTLHWKTTTPDGKVNEGDEKIVYKKLNDHQYFLNWIEKDGLSISQVIDTKENSVMAFGTYADEKSPRGKRSGMTLEGSFEFEK